jgi:integrase
MAWLQQRGKKFRICFRHDGELYRLALGTANQKEAEACRARLEDTLNRLERGWLKVPSDIDLPVFLLSGGEVANRRSPSATPKPTTLGGLRDGYLKAQATSLESDSLRTLRTHLNHIVRTLGEESKAMNLTLADLQRHVERRRAKKGRRGKPITGYTIRKEVASFAAVWKWAVHSGLVSGEFPNTGVEYPKRLEKPAFQTRAEIERQIERGSFSKAEVSEFWEGLFLTLPETAEVLAHVKAEARHGFIYPMACFAAHTAARRSEILRSRVADFDLELEVVTVREKKAVQGVQSTRRVALSPFLVQVMREWLTQHPGCPDTFCHVGTVWKSRAKRTGPTPISRDEAHDHLRRTLEGGKWSVVRGWHVFRHSFISNCAARGVDQRLIDAWVGHTTEEMRRRYRHLLPDQSALAIRTVFDGQ